MLQNAKCSDQLCNGVQFVPTCLVFVDPVTSVADIGIYKGVSSLEGGDLH